MDEYERVLLVKNDVQAFKIPPKTTARAYRASDWSLDAPDWNCRLRLISIGKKCYLKLDEKNTGQFFGQCPIETYPSDSIEPVSDSSRYFVVKLVNEQTGRAAFLGIGFIDRSDSFDLNVTLQDHFKIMKNEEDGEDSKESTAPKLDLGFKEGQTIKVNLNLKKKSLANKPKGALGLGSGGILLPPPPSGSSKTTTTSTLSSSSSSSSALNSDPFSGQFENLSVDNKPETSTDNTKETKNIDLLFDFGSFESSPAPSSTTNIPSTIASSTNQQANWANFD